MRFVIKLNFSILWSAYADLRIMYNDTQNLQHFSGYGYQLPKFSLHMHYAFSELFTLTSSITFLNGIVAL